MFNVHSVINFGAIGFKPNVSLEVTFFSCTALRIASTLFSGKWKTKRGMRTRFSHTSNSDLQLTISGCHCHFSGHNSSWEREQHFSFGFSANRMGRCSWCMRAINSMILCLIFELQIIIICNGHRSNSGSYPLSCAHIRNRFTKKYDTNSQWWLRVLSAAAQQLNIIYELSYWISRCAVLNNERHCSSRHDRFQWT